MNQHLHHTENPDMTQPAEACQHCESSGQDLKNASYIVGGAILAGALILSAALFYSSSSLVKGLSGTQIGSAGGAQVAAQNGAQQAAQQPAAPGAAVDIKLAPNTPYLGSGSAKVTVVEYADYECPYCERWYTTVMPDLKSKYIDTGKIKFVYQDFAFLGPDSNTLAEGSHCAADQGKFWQYHDYVFTHQGQENSGWGTPDKVKAIAAAMGGLNTSQFNQCLDSGKYKQEVLNETSAGKTYGVNGTPTIFVNGTAIVGAQPASTFTAAIDAALAK